MCVHPITALTLQHFSCTSITLLLHAFHNLYGSFVFWNLLDQYSACYSTILPGLYDSISVMQNLLCHYSVSLLTCFSTTYQAFMVLFCNLYATHGACTVLFQQPLHNLLGLQNAFLLACFSITHWAFTVLFLQPLPKSLGHYGALSTTSKQHTSPLGSSFCNICSAYFVVMALHSWLAFSHLTRPLQCSFYNLCTNYLASKVLYPCFLFGSLQQ